MRALGLMSGTSMDGVDVAMLDTDGETVAQRYRGQTYPYTDAMRRDLAAAIAEARTMGDRGARPGCLADVERALTEVHGAAVARYIDETPEAKVGTIDLIGFHGQTVVHKPAQGLTVQLGDGPRLAEITGLPVAYDLRAADVVAGGQGAPLAPVYHRAMVAALAERPVAVLNIGGVANVTWIGERSGVHDDLIAFDTGPGNALLDDWMAKTVGASRDEGGGAALAGQADTRVVRFFLDDPFFASPPPKSLDRNTFFWDLVTGLSVEDGAATLVAMTVGAVHRALDHMPTLPKRWIVCGGGRHNAAMMAGLRTAFGVPVSPAEEIGFDGDAVEAEAWAYLAVRAKLGKPLTYPGTTGVAAPLSGGRFAG